MSGGGQARSSLAWTPPGERRPPPRGLAERCAHPGCAAAGTHGFGPAGSGAALWAPRTWYCAGHAADVVLERAARPASTGVEKRDMAPKQGALL